MPYNINKTNGEQLVVVDEGTADLTSTSITLIGKNYSGYGESLNENLVHILENFSNSTSPASPIGGQLWYDTGTKILKLYNGRDWVNSGAGIELDNASVTAHYNVFVGDIEGAPAFKTAGAKGLSLSPATGNHAIGRSTPASARFEINNSSIATKTFNAFPQGAIGQEVGLHIHGDDSINGRSTRFVMDSYGSASSFDGIGPHSIIHLRRSRGNSLSGGALRIDDPIGSIAAHGHDGTGFSQTFQGSLIFRADENWSSTRRGTRLELYLTPRDSLVNLKAVTIYGNGDVKAEGDVVAYNSSDLRLKTDIKVIPDALLKVKKLQGITFDWNELAANKNTDQRQVGVIAQQVQEVLPEAVNQRSDGYLGVNYEKLVPLLIQAINELSEQLGK